MWGWSGQPDQLLSGFRSILPINQCTPSASVHIDHLAEINQFSSSMFYVNQAFKKQCTLEHASEVKRRFRMHLVQIYQKREREKTCFLPSYIPCAWVNRRKVWLWMRRNLPTITKLSLLQPLEFCLDFSYWSLQQHHWLWSFVNNCRTGSKEHPCM